MFLHVYPEGRSHFTLYEDDGLSFGYEKGEFAQTEITCRRQENEAVLTISPRQGTYTGMPQRRSFAVQIHGIRPARILLNNQSLAEGPQGWQWDNKANAVRLQVNEDPERKAPQVVQLLW